MRVVVTGARGKVGGAAARALVAAGHEVVATDLGPAVYERDLPDEPLYVQADLTDAGSAHAFVRGADAVVHAAAIPDPIHNAPHVVFQNNLMCTFNVVEACVRAGVGRLVHISSESVPGFVFPERSVLPRYVPVDEDHPITPQDPYALGKWFSELLCDAASQRSDLRCISLRPSWVLHPGNYERNLGPIVRDPAQPNGNMWSYTDLEDLADAIVLAAASELPGHEVIYVANPDNSGGRPLADLVHAVYGDAIEIRALAREDAAGISSAKAHRLLGWAPTRSWRDHLDDHGRARAAPAGG